MNYLSLFSGVGGFELGIQRAYSAIQEPKQEIRQYEAGLRPAGDKRLPVGQYGDGRRVRPLCIGYSEIDNYAIQTYQKNWKGHTNYGNATAIKPSELPDFELVVGGFPCQAFSVAGKRKGFDEARGTLFFDIARILTDKRPRHILLENVKGLLNHDGGKTIQVIAGVLSELGYRIEWQVLNAKDFGVPQNRERIFIVGHLRGKCGRQVFPIGGAAESYSQKLSSTALDSNYFKGIDNHGQRTAVAVAPTIRATQHKSGDNQTLVIEQLNNPTHSNDRVYSARGISPTLNTMGGGNRQPFVVPVLTPDRVEKRQNGRRFKENGEPSFTLNTQDRHGIFNGSRIRRLTPLECERLMSWPDGWTEGVSDTQRYKQCGNGVVSNCVQAVVEKMILEGCL